MATDYSAVPEDASVAPQETGFWDNVGNIASNVGQSIADTTTEVAKDTFDYVSNATEKVGEAVLDANNVVANTWNDYSGNISTGAQAFWNNVTSEEPDADITKVSESNKDLVAQIKIDQEDSAMTNAIETVGGWIEGGVKSVYNNFWNNVDEKYFEDTDKVKGAFETYNAFVKSNTDPSDPKFYENQTEMIKELRGFMKGGYNLSDQAVLDNFNAYQKEKDSVENDNGDDKVNKIISDKVNKLVQEDVPGAEFNMKKKEEFTKGFKEELTQVVTAQADLARQAARGGISQEAYDKQMAKYDEIIAIKTRVNNDLLKYIATDTNALDSNVGENGALYEKYKSLVSLEEAQKLIDYERNYSTETNMIVAASQIKEGNPAMKLLGAFNTAVTGVGGVLNVKALASPLLGRDYNTNDKDSIMNALASDENYISLANLSGIAYAFRSSLNNIDDIANIVAGSGKFNAVSKINKVTNFLDKANSNVAIRTLATYGKGIIEGASANQLLAIQGNQVATDEYMLTNMLLDGPLENLIGAAGQGIGKLSGYTSLAEARQFSKAYIADLTTEIASTTDPKRLDTLNKTLANYKNISAEEQRASIAGLKELAKANMDFAKRNDVLKDKNSLVSFAKGIVDEFNAKGNVPYQNNGIILQSVSYKKNPLTQLDAFVNSIHSDGTDILSDYNVSKMKSIVSNAESFVKFIPNQEARATAVSELNSFKPYVQEIAKKKRSNTTIGADEYQDVAQKIMDFKSKYSGQQVKEADSVTLTDILTGDTIKINMKDKMELNEVSVNGDGKITRLGKQYTMAKLKYDTDTMKLITALTDTGETTGWFGAKDNVSETAREIERKLGLSEGYIEDGSQNKGYLKLENLSGGKYKLSLGSRVPKNEEGVSVGSAKNLKGILEGAEEHEITARILLDSVGISKLAEDDTLLRLTFNTLKPVLQKMIPDPWEFNKFAEMATLSFQSETILGIMKNVKQDTKRDSLMFYLTEAATNFNKINNRPELKNLGNMIMSLKGAEYGITKAELLTQIFSGVVKLTDNMSIKPLMEALGVKDISIYKKISETSPADMNVITNAWKSINPNGFDDAIFRLKYTKQQSDFKKYLVKSELLTHFIESIVGKKDLGSYNKNGGKEYQAAVSNFLKTLKPDLKDVDLDGANIKKALTDIVTASTGDAKLKAQSDLDQFNAYVKNGEGYMQQLKQFQARVKTAMNMDEVFAIHNEAIDAVNDMDYHTDDILAEIQKLHDALHFKKTKIKGEALMSLESMGQIGDLFQTLAKTFQTEITGVDYVSKAFINANGEAINWGDVPHVAIGNSYMKWKPLEIEGKINPQSLRDFEDIIKAKYDGTDLKSIREESKSQNHYESKVLDSKFGRDMYKARNGGSIALDINAVESLATAFNMPLKSVDDVSAMIVTIQKSLMNTQGDRYDDSMARLISDYREAIIKDIEKEAKIDQGMEVKQPIFDSLTIVSETFQKGLVTNSISATIGKFLVELGIDKSKGRLDGIVPKSKKTRELKKELSKYLIPDNCVYSMLMNQLNAGKKPLLDLLIGKDGWYDDIAAFIGYNGTLPNIKALQDMKKFLDKAKLSAQNNQLDGFVKGGVEAVEDEINNMLEEALLNNLPKEFFKPFNIEQAISGLSYAGKITENLEDVLNGVKSPVTLLEYIPKNGKPPTAEMKALQQELLQQVIQILGKIQQSPIGQTVIGKMQAKPQAGAPAGKFQLDPKKISGFVSKLTEGFEKAYVAAIKIQVEGSQVKPIDEVAFKAEQDEKFAILEPFMEAVMQSMKNRGDADINKFSDGNQTQIRQKILSSIDNNNSTFFYDGASLGGSGFKRSTERLEHSFGYNKLFQLEKQLDLTFSNIKKGDIGFKYKDVKLLGYEENLIPTVRKLNLWKDMSDEDIMVAVQYLNNIKYVNNVLSKTEKDIGRNIDFNVKKDSLFSEKRISPEMLKELNSSKTGSSLGDNFIGIPYIGEDSSKGFIINPTDKMILKAFNPQGGKSFNVDDYRVLVDTVSNGITDDVKMIRELEMFKDTRTLAKRVKPSMASGNGSLKSNLEVAEILLEKMIYKDLIGLKDFGIEIDGKKTIITEPLTQDELDELVKMNGGNDRVDIDLTIAQVAKTPVTNLITQLDTAIAGLSKLSQVASTPAEVKAIEDAINEGKKLVGIIDTETDLIKLNSYKKELNDKVDQIKIVFANIRSNNTNVVFATKKLAGIDETVKDLDTMQGDLLDLINNRISFNSPRTGNGFNLSDFKDLKNLENDINQTYYKAVKSYLVSNKVPELKGILEAGSDGQFKDANGNILDKDFMGFMRSQSRDTVANKIIIYVNSDVIDGTGWQSQSFAKKIFEESVGRKYKASDEDSLFDMKSHIVGQGHLTKTKQFTLRAETDAKVRAFLESKGYIKPGQDFILSPEGGVKTKSSGFTDAKGEVLDVGTYDLKIKGYRNFSAKDIEYASQHSIDHKQSVKISTQMIVTESPTNQNLMWNIMLLKAKKTEAQGLKSYQGDRVLVNNDGTAFGIQTMNDHVTTHQQKILGMVEGNEINGSNLSVKDSGTYIDAKGVRKHTEIGKIYVSDWFLKEHAKDMVQVGDKFYVSTHRNPVPTGYNKGLYEIVVSKENIGYQLTGNPMDIIFKKEGDYDGDTISLVFADTDKLDGLFAKVNFIGTAMKTNIGYEQTPRFGLTTEKEITDYVNAEYKKVLDLIKAKQDAGENVVNYWIPTSQVDALEGNMVGRPSMYSNSSTILSFTNAVTAKNKIGHVSVAEETVQSLAADIERARYDSEFAKNRYGNLNLGYLAEFFDGISRPGNIMMSDLLQMTIDFSKATTEFPDEWMKNIGGVFEYKKGPDGKDLISDSLKAIALAHIKEIGKNIKDFKQHNTLTFPEMDISKLPPLRREVYKQLQDSIKRLENGKIKQEELKATQKMIMEKYFDNTMATTETAYDPKLSDKRWSTKQLVSGYLKEGGYLTPFDGMVLRSDLGFGYLDSIIGIAEKESPIIKVGKDAEDLVKIYANLTAGLTDDNKKLGFELMGQDRPMFSMMMFKDNGMDAIKIVKTPEFTRGSELKLLNMIADGEDKYQKSLRSNPNDILSDNWKMKASLAYHTTGISSISKLYTDDMRNKMFVFQGVQYGSRVAKERLQAELKRYMKDEAKANEIVELLQVYDTDGKVIDFMSQIDQKIFTNEDLTTGYNVNIIRQGEGKAKITFTTKDARQAIVDKVKTGKQIDDLEYEILHTDYANVEDTPISFYFVDGQLAKGEKPFVKGQIQFNTGDIFNKFISENSITKAEYYKNVESFNSEMMPKLLDDTTKIVNDIYQARSLKINDIFTSYFPDLAARVLRIRNETKLLAPILNRFRDINGKYSKKYGRDARYNQGLKEIENKMFKASRNMDLSKPDVNRESFVPRKTTENEEYYKDFKSYSEELGMLLGKDLNNALVSLDYNINKLPEVHKGSFLLDFLEDAAGGHTAALNERGWFDEATLRKEMEKVATNKGISKLVMDSNIKNVTNAIFDKGNDSVFIKGIKSVKGVAAAFKYSFIAGLGGFLTTSVQLMADFLMMISYRSPSFRDPRVEQFAIEHRILNAEKINSENIINDSAPSQWLMVPLHGTFKVVRGFLPGTTLKDWSKYVENTMANTLSLNDQILYNMRRKIATANAFDTLARGTTSVDELFAQFDTWSPKAKQTFKDQVSLLAQKNFLAMSGGTSTGQMMQETVFSRGGHNVWNFLAGWGTNMTSLHLTGVSSLFSATRNLIHGDTKAAMTQYREFADYTGRMLNTTILASALIAKYDILYNDREREDGEYDMLRFAININNAISGLRSFILISSAEGALKKTSDNNSTAENAAILGKEILNKFGREFNLPKDIIAFISQGLKEDQSSEHIMNGTIDLIRNYANTYLTFNRFDTNDTYYKDLYTTNLFSTMMGVRDIDSYDEIFDKASNKSQGDLFRFMSPTQTFLTLLNSSSYIKMLTSLGGESFQWEIQKIKEMNQIKENDKLLKNAITQGITPEILQSIMFKGEALDKEATKALYDKLTGYASIGMGNFLSDGFGDTAYQMKKFGSNPDLSQQLVSAKLEEKYGKKMVDAIVRGDMEFLSKHLETQVGSEMYKNFLGDNPAEADSNKNRKDLLVAFEKTGISIPTMISILTYQYAYDLKRTNKGVGEAEAQALAIKKYYPLINGDVNAITDVTNAYMLKKYPDISGMFKKSEDGRGVMSQSIKNKMLLDNLVARSYYETGETGDLVLSSRWSSLFNNIYNTMKDQDGGITKANAKEMVVNYLMVDEQLKDLSGKSDPEKIFKYRETVFASMLQKPEVMVELSDTLASLGKEDNYTRVAESLVKRLFDFNNEAVTKNLPDFGKAVQENYNRTYGKRSSGSGKSYGGFSAPAKKPYAPRENNYGNGKDLLKNAMDRGLDLGTPSPRMFTGGTPYPSIGGLGGPSQFYNGLKDQANIMYAQMQDQLSKDLFRKSPEYIEKIYRVMRARAEGIGLKNNIKLQSFEQLPGVWRKPLSKGLLKGLAYNRPEN